MGSGGSTAQQLLSSQQESALTPSTRRTFETEARARQEEHVMTHSELQLHLTKLYLQLIDELATRQYGGDSAKSSSAKGSSGSAKGSTGTSNANVNANTKKSNAVTKKPWGGEFANAKNAKRRSLLDLYRQESRAKLQTITDDAAKLDDEFQELDQGQEPGQEQEQSGLESQEFGQDSWTPARQEDVGNKTEPGASVTTPKCYLCNKQFTYEWQLKQHVAFSKLHHLAVDERDKLSQDAQRKVERLTGIVRSGNSLFASPGTKIKLSEEVAAAPRARWRAAIGRVIQRQTFERYQIFLGELQLKQNNTASTQCIYSGSKFFWRHRLTLGIHCYDHCKFKCIEVISQFHDQGQASSRIQRIYLCKSALAASIAEQHKAKVAWEEWLQSEKGRWERQRLSQKVEENIATGLLVECLLSGLSLSDDAQTVCFQPSSTSDPCLQKKPSGLTPAVLDVVQLTQLWEIEQAVAHVNISTSALCDSVRHCERLASVLDETAAELAHKAFVAKERQDEERKDEPSAVKKNLRLVATRLVRIQEVQKTEARLQGLDIKKQYQLELQSIGAKGSPVSSPISKSVHHRGLGGSPTITGAQQRFTFNGSPCGSQLPSVEEEVWQLEGPSRKPKVTTSAL